MEQGKTGIVPNQGGNILRNTLDFPRSDKTDTVKDIFKIHLDEEIHELSNKFCKYYHASNLDDESRFFAIVYESSFIVPVMTIDSLCKNPIDGVNKILSWSIVRISSDNLERLVVIVNSYNYSNNLLSYVEKNGSISLSSNEKIIEKITNVISELSARGIYGYNISPFNILMNEDQDTMLNLREFINSYPYFNEKDQYIAPELIECLKVSRRTKNCKQDIYALGVTIFYSFSALSPWEKFSQEGEYNEQRLAEGSYKYLTQKTQFSKKIRIFLRSVVHDSPSIRWDTKNIYDWLGDKKDETIYDSPNSINKYTIGFNNQNYSNPKSLSYAMFRFWEKANKFIKDAKFLLWVGKQQFSNETVASIKSVIDARYKDSMFDTNGVSIYSDQKLTKLLSIIDPNGSLRYETIAVSAESIPETLQHLQTLKKQSLFKEVIKIMKDKNWQNYTSIYSPGFLEETKGNEFHYLAERSDNTLSYKNNERLIYSFNPYLPCLSSMLNGKYVNNIKELLLALDSYAQKQPNNFIIDRHVSAFIAAKLDLKDNIKSVILLNFPKFAEHHTVKSLSTLNLLYQHEPDVKITNICKAISLELIKLFDQYLHNTEFKKHVVNKIESVAEEGSIPKIIDIFSNQQQFIDDYNGYYQACKQAKSLEEEIMTLSAEVSNFNNASIILGQKTTVLASYILCLVAIIAIVI
jgi:hypothetical protein